MKEITSNSFKKPNTHAIDVMCIKDVAGFLKVSTSWLYKHYQEVGGVKIGGSYRFPSKEAIYERLFGQEEGMVGVFLPISKEGLQQGRVQEKERCSGSRGRKKERVKTIDNRPREGTNRHGLLDVA